jgi:hypothetical protein
MKLNTSVKIALVTLVLSGLLTLALAQQNALTTLGVQESGMKGQVVGSLTEGRVPIYEAAKAFKKLDAAMRAKMVQGALSWAKAYVESPAFRADYGKQREAGKPTALKPKGTVDEEMARQSAERKKSLVEMKQNVAKMPPDMQKQMAATVKQMEESFAKTESDPQMVSLMRQSIEMQRAAEEKSFRESLAAYDKKWPADPMQLIARRLEQFLEVSKDVDYKAQLFSDRGTMKFMDARYQGKPDNWKLCFRAGKEATDAARAFAASWLKEIKK